jgi:hypothetical protein
MTSAPSRRAPRLRPARPAMRGKGIPRLPDVSLRGGMRMTDSEGWFRQWGPQQGHGRQCPQEAPWQPQQYDPRQHAQRTYEQAPFSPNPAPAGYTDQRRAPQAHDGFLESGRRGISSSSHRFILSRRGPGGSPPASGLTRRNLPNILSADRGRPAERSSLRGPFVSVRVRTLIAISQCSEPCPLRPPCSLPRGNQSRWPGPRQCRGGTERHSHWLRPGLIPAVACPCT